MMVSKNILNTKGFTAVEVMVGVGLVALLTLVMVTTQLMVSKDQADLMKQLDASIDETLSERILYSDFSSIDPSYNNLSVMDDSDRNFFDYYPDIPGNLLNAPLNRSITMSTTSKIKVFSILSQDVTMGPVMNYDPTAAYDIGTAPADFNTAATLKFVSLNRKSFISVVRPEFWQEGRTLMLDTPAKLRPVVAGLVDMKIPPRSPTYIGTVRGWDLVAMNSDPKLAKLFNYTQPETGSLIESADTFLRRAPSIGGGQTLVRLRAVKVVQYYLETSPNAKNSCRDENTKAWYKPGNLVKVTYQKGAFSQPFMLSDSVCSFELTRDSVMKRMIYFKVNKIDQNLLKSKMAEAQGSEI